MVLPISGHFDKGLNLFFHLAGGITAGIGVVGLDDQTGFSGLLRDPFFEIVLTEGIGLATSVGMHDESVGLVLVHQLDHLGDLMFQSQVEMDGSIRTGKTF